MSITHSLEFNGEFLERGFWLYVWDVTTPAKKHLYYVGRTGDSFFKQCTITLQPDGAILGLQQK